MTPRTTAAIWARNSLLSPEGGVWLNRSRLSSSPRNRCDQRQAEAGDLLLGGVSAEGDGGPGLDRAGADQVGGHLEDDRRNLPAGEGALGVGEGLGDEPAGGQRRAEVLQSLRVAGEGIVHVAGEDGDAVGLFHGVRGAPDGDEPPLTSSGRLCPCGAPDLVRLLVPTRLGGVRLAEGRRERDVLAPVAVGVEPEFMDCLPAEQRRHRGIRLGVDRERHRRAARSGVEEVEVAQVQSGVLATGRSVEVVRHGESSRR